MREEPKIVASLPLINTIVGPPTNLAVTPDESLALVANSLAYQQDGAGWKGVPDNKLFVIDLKSAPAKLIATVDVGKQPSGLAVNKAGNLLLIANRADSSVSVLTIKGQEVKLVESSRHGRSGRRPSPSRLTASTRSPRRTRSTRSRFSISTARR